MADYRSALHEKGFIILLAMRNNEVSKLLQMRGGGTAVINDK